MLTEDEKKEIIYIMIAGGCGGIISLIYSITLGNSPVIPILPWGILSYICLGITSGYIGVYLLAKSDTRNFTHCLGFALVCGIAWAPVIDGGTALVKQHRENKLEKTASLTKNDIVKTVSEIKDADNKNLYEIKDKLLSYVSQLEKISNQAYTVSTRHEAEQGLVLVDNAFDELNKKNPSLLAEYDVQRGKPSMNSEYKYKVLLTDRRPGDWHVHAMMNANADGPIIGPGKWLSFSIPSDVFINQPKPEDVEKSPVGDKTKDNVKTKH